MAGITAGRLLGSGFKGGLIGAGAAIAAVIGFNTTRSPDRQTVEGIDNTTLMVIALSVVAFAWLTSK